MADETPPPVIVGVDTHADNHVAVVIDHVGRRLDSIVIPAATAGYERLVDWVDQFGTVEAVGVEGTGSYGAGLARFLTDAGVKVVEVGRVNRQHRRRNGKTDSVDAEAAARAVLSGEATGVPKTRDSYVESIRVLHLVKRSAIKARTQAANQIYEPDCLRPGDNAQRTCRVDSVETSPQGSEMAARPKPRPCHGDQACNQSTGPPVARSQRGDRGP